MTTTEIIQWKSRHTVIENKIVDALHAQVLSTLPTEITYADYWEALQAAIIVWENTR